LEVHNMMVTGLSSAYKAHQCLKPMVSNLQWLNLQQ
jgi:hypothetical protein